MRMAGRFSRRVRGYVKRMVFRLWIVRPESARFFLDEAEHFRHNRRASVATLRELFAFGPESAAGGCSGTTAFARRAESRSARCVVLYDPHRHAGRFPATGAGRMNIDNYFFKL